MYPTPVGPQFEPVGRCAARRRRLALAAWRTQRSRSTTSTSPMTASWCQADLSFAVAAGEIIGIARPNGADKTNTVEIPQGLRSRVRRPATSTCPGSTPATNASDCVRHMVYSCRPHRFRIDRASAKRWACWPSSPATKSTGGRRPLHLGRVVRKPYCTLSGRQRHCSSLSRWSTAHGSCSLDEHTQGPRSRRTAGNVAADRASPRQGHHGRGVE
jgi:hypothetical protein